MRLSIALIAGALCASVFTATADESDRAASDRRDDCKVVQLKPGEAPPSNSMSTSVTAGGGRVSGMTTGPSGVTVHSGDGASAMASASTTSADGTTTTVTSSNGGCTIYRRAKE